MRVPFTLVTRGILRQGEQFLLCKAKGYDFWFLPGGGVEDREDAASALAREVGEETGLTVQDISFVAAVQNYFANRDVFENEINLVFDGTIADDTSVQSLEDHIEVALFSVPEIDTLHILPVSLKTLLLQYARGERVPHFVGAEKIL